MEGEGKGKGNIRRVKKLIYLFGSQLVSFHFVIYSIDSQSRHNTRFCWELWTGWGIGKGKGNEKENCIYGSSPFYFGKQYIKEKLRNGRVYEKAENYEIFRFSS